MDPQNTPVIPAEIRQFLEGLLDEASINIPDDQTREDMIQELFYQLDNYLTSLIVDNLPQEDLDTFIKMNEEQKPKEEIEAFMTSKIPDAQNLFTQGFLEFKNLYLQEVIASQNENPQTNPPDNTQPQDN